MRNLTINIFAFSDDLNIIIALFIFFKRGEYTADLLQEEVLVDFTYKSIIIRFKMIEDYGWKESNVTNCLC